MKVVLISGHTADQPRKTGFHFWAEILARRGVDVDFVTVGSSPISLIKKNGKSLKKPYNEWVELSPRIRKFIWMPFFHPLYLGNRFLDALTWPIFSLYPRMMPRKLLSPLSKADMFIVENGCGLMLVPHLARINPAAKFVYNFSDRFGVVKFHPIVEHSQLAALSHFSLIRLNSSAFRHDFPDDVETNYIPQSIDKSVFDLANKNPYGTPRNAISIGDMIFDSHAVETLAEKFPDWNFHIFGKGAKLHKTFPNVIEYGEYPFEELVPYIKYADIALAPYDNSPNAEYLSESSLKLVQYTYCKLPVVAPDFAAKGRDHVLPYTIGSADRTIESAFIKAQSYDRRTIDVTKVMDWADVVDCMLSAPNKKPDKKIIYLLTSKDAARCGVKDYTEKLSDALKQKGMKTFSEVFPQWSYKNLVYLWKKYGGRSDIIFHTQYPSLSMGSSTSPAFIPLIMRKAAAYLTLHEFSRFSVRRKSIFLCTPFFLKKIVFTHEFERDAFLKHAPLQGKTTIIPIGSNIEVIKEAPPAKRKKIVYFGQISQDKGLEFFMKTIAILRQDNHDYECEIIGSIVDKNAPINEQIREFCSLHNVNLTLDIPDEIVSQKLLEASVALLPFPDGITEKRGTALACLSHHVTIVTLHTDKTPSWFKETTYGADSEENAASLITGILEGNIALNPHSDVVNAEMASRGWNQIAERHISLYGLNQSR